MKDGLRLVGLIAVGVFLGSVFADTFMFVLYLLLNILTKASIGM